MSDNQNCNRIASTRLVNCMKNYGFLPNTRDIETNAPHPISPGAIREAAPRFLAHMMEEVPGQKDDGWPWRNTRPGPRWKRDAANFGKKTLDELLALAGAKHTPLKYVSVCVPEDRAEELLQIAAKMREQPAPETGAAVSDKPCCG